MASNQARAYFALSGYHFNPDDITRLLGVQPTSVNAAGASSGLDKPVISSWELSTNMITDDIDVYKLTDVIIKQLEPVKDKMLQVIKSQHRVQIHLYQQTKPEPPRLWEINCGF